jgi:hypothetical protein
MTSSPNLFLAFDTDFSSYVCLSKATPRQNDRQHNATRHNNHQPTAQKPEGFVLFDSGH